MALEELYALARRIREAERAGVLEQMDGFGGAESIREDRPLPQEDTVLVYRCAGCGERFSLRWNSEFGRGGSWGLARGHGFPTRRALAS